MARTIRLRPWQKDALEKFRTTERPDFLAVATPGAGKTTFALTAACHWLAENPEALLVVVAPTQHLKRQWAQAASAFHLALEPFWKAGDPLPAAGVCLSPWADLTQSGATVAEKADADPMVHAEDRALVDGHLDAEVCSRLAHGIEHQGETLTARSVRVLREGARHQWLEVVLDEGRNRQIRRMLEVCGVSVKRLVRVAIGDLDAPEPLVRG